MHCACVDSAMTSDGMGIIASQLSGPHGAHVDDIASPTKLVNVKVSAPLNVDGINKYHVVASLLLRIKESSLIFYMIQ